MSNWSGRLTCPLCGEAVAITVLHQAQTVTLAHEGAEETLTVSIDAYLELARPVPGIRPAVRDWLERLHRH